LEGEFDSNEKLTKGKLSFNNGDVFEGEFDSNEKLTKGKLVFKNGDGYEGEWVDGRITKCSKYYMH
jgi:hypothetical protein